MGTNKMWSRCLPWSIIPALGQRDEI